MTLRILFALSLTALAACSDYAAGVGISSGGGATVGVSGATSNGTRGSLSVPIR